MSAKGVDINFRMYRVDPPCRGCEKRSAGCHASCENYAQWKEQNEAFKAYMRDRINADADVRAFLSGKAKRSQSGYFNDDYRFKGGDKNGRT